MVPLPFAMWLGEHDGVLMARLAGHFGVPWADEVRRDLLHTAPGAVWLDLSRLTSIDPPGLAALVAIRQGVVSGGGRVILHGLTDPVRRIFAAAGLDALVDDDRVVEATGPDVLPVTHLPVKGGRNGRRSPAAAPKVA